jgi:hypothetical protein
LKDVRLQGVSDGEVEACRLVASEVGHEYVRRTCCRAGEEGWGLALRRDVSLREEVEEELAEGIVASRC